MRSCDSISFAWWWISVPELALLVAGAAAQHQQRDALRERARDRVHHVVAARAVGDAHHADASGGARVAVGREAHPGLVRQRDDAQPASRAEADEEAEHEVARDAEEMRDADLPQVGDQEVAEDHRRLHAPRSRPVAARSGEELHHVAGRHRHQTGLVAAEHLERHRLAGLAAPEMAVERGAIARRRGRRPRARRRRP